jgi:hypothetical protein
MVFLYRASGTVISTGSESTGNLLISRDCKKPNVDTNVDAARREACANKWIFITVGEMKGS